MTTNEKLKQAYQEGKAAYLDGKDNYDNPYQVGGMMWSEWDNGWYAAYRADSSHARGAMDE